MQRRLWKRHLGSRRADRPAAALTIRRPLAILLFAALLSPAMAVATEGGISDQIWTLRIVRATLGPPTTGSMLPPTVPCLPCSADQPGGTLFEWLDDDDLVLDVSESDPVDPDIILTGVYLGVGNVTYYFDLSEDPALLASYEAAAVALLVVENPPPNLRNQKLTLRFTTNQGGEDYWEEAKLVWKEKTEEEVP